MLAVPYALRARNAEVADALGTIDSGFLSEIMEHQSFDGQPPSNLDSREGLGDADGDGKANFLEADNDNDGILDGTEITQGSDINLVTPTISGATPSFADELVSTVVQIQGTGFESGMAVQFGSQNPAPTNLMSTTFD